MHELMAAPLDTVVGEITAIQTAARAAKTVTRPRWPMIVLASPKGWTGPHEIDGRQTEGSWRSHQVPMSEVRGVPEHLAILERWMKSYRPEALFDQDGRLRQEIAALGPK